MVVAHVLAMHCLQYYRYTNRRTVLLPYLATFASAIAHVLPTLVDIPTTVLPVRYCTTGTLMLVAHVLAVQLYSTTDTLMAAVQVVQYYS